MAAYTSTQALTQRERHDAIRTLLGMASEDDPPIALIRKAIAKLSPADICHATERAHELWPRVFPGEHLGRDFDFVCWSQTAPRDQLLEAVQTFFSDGGEVVAGRARPGGKRSPARLEPHIHGYARGAASTSRSRAEKSAGSLPPPGGRPAAEAADDLVRGLGLLWNRVTGLAPEPGRSDHTVFGALVHHVFGWLEIGTAEPSLRRYWAEVSDAEIIETEGGRIYR